MFRLNDSIIYFHDVLRDTLGNDFNNNRWKLNRIKTVRCGWGNLPFFFKDGSALIANGKDNWGVPCNIINPPDTFPGRIIIKLTPTGLWDSTFTHDASGSPRRFTRYDSNRILISGYTRNFTHYDSVDVDGLCRIYLDGTLDTTFNSPIADLPTSGVFTPQLIEDNGKILLVGRFLLKGRTHTYETLVRLNPDGSLDPTFMNFGGPRDTNNLYGSVGPVCKTPDGGYLVGGYFDVCQNHWAKGIVKLDSNGAIEPQYFTRSGPDSSQSRGNGYPSINVIRASKFGGYYVGGDFLKWDGQPSDPIVRLTGLITGVSKHNKTLVLKGEVSIYPNPSNSLVNVISSQPILQIQIFDVRGKLVKTIETPSSQIDISELKGGLYILSIHFKNGSLNHQKLLKE